MGSKEGAEERTRGPAKPRRAASAAAASAAAASAAAALANPPTAALEFGGPVGAACCTALMPAAVFLLERLLAAPAPGLADPLASEDRPPRPLPSPAKGFLDPRAALYFAAWMAFVAAMYYFPWRREVEGVPLRDGKRLKYNANAVCTLGVTLAVAAAVTYCHGPAPLVDVYDRIPGLIVASVICADPSSSRARDPPVLTGRTRLRPSPRPDDPALPYNYNSTQFFMGRELNPRIGSLDLKYVCELRPGLIGWVVINLAAAAKQFQQAGRITDSMFLTILFQLWYVADSHISEQTNGDRFVPRALQKSVLTTMDITTDGFGFMLTFGDLVRPANRPSGRIRHWQTSVFLTPIARDSKVWVPFTYSLQARYLAVHPVDLGNGMALLVTLVNFLGYGIFRGANKQKDLFRSRPDCEASKAMTYITTKTGSKLITSGWWGMARHINYLGDWIMGLAWCLPCGLPAFPAVPYFYAAYFAGLLFHRQRRDDEKCARKYGGDWERYCRIVKWRIIPGVY
ncbi:MAG: ergosterol biosynthesis ERG4/ERG24 family-domain-containing protein [Olpidium bornovanus]|uniref:Ergosterol biosynthesis ERG4/ERG24 family-domain-containing protein n=1 Tax=Olpidium bornovanus TaxID=278681 RepID=A0A8H7ZR03_9FUNG|nr:MAG: ergosterol biosynthesis ERG4/ERG24 family-domain-containing protein [Olpidium bornovanus]